MPDPLQACGPCFGAAGLPDFLATPLTLRSPWTRTARALRGISRYAIATGRWIRSQAEIGPLNASSELPKPRQNFDGSGKYKLNWASAGVAQPSAQCRIVSQLRVSA